jgi:hypothetical protein
MAITLFRIYAAIVGLIVLALVIDIIMLLSDLI